MIAARPRPGGAPGLDVITDGEQTRLDFNLSFYGHLEGLERARRRPPRRFGPPAPRPARPPPRDRRAAGARAASAWWRSSSGCGGSRPPGPALKASVPGPYTLERPPASRASATPTAGRSPRRCCPSCAPSSRRWWRPAAARSAVDEPSMSCYAHREDPRAASWTSSTARSRRSSARCRLSTHLCFGNYKGRAVAPAALRAALPRLPRRSRCDEIHVEMASREFAEIEVIGADRRGARTWRSGIVDVKSY